MTGARWRTERGDEEKKTRSARWKVLKFSLMPRGAGNTPALDGYCKRAKREVFRFWKASIMKMKTVNLSLMGWWLIFPFLLGIVLSYSVRNFTVVEYNARKGEIEKKENMRWGRLEMEILCLIMSSALFVKNEELIGNLDVLVSYYYDFWNEKLHASPSPRLRHKEGKKYEH